MLEPENIINEESLKITEDLYPEFGGFIGKLDISSYLQDRVI